MWAGAVCSSGIQQHNRDNRDAGKGEFCTGCEDFRAPSAVSAESQPENEISQVLGSCSHLGERDPDFTDIA